MMAGKEVVLEGKMKAPRMAQMFLAQVQLTGYSSS